MQSHGPSLAEPSDIHSVVGIDVGLWFLAIPLSRFLIHVLFNDGQTLLNVLEVKDIFLFVCESFEGGHIVPGMAHVPSIDRDVAQGSLQQFDPGPCIEGRVRMGEEGQEAFSSVAHSVEPDEGVLWLSVGECDGAVLHVAVDLGYLPGPPHDAAIIIMANKSLKIS